MIKYKWLWCLISVLLFSAGWHNVTGLTMFVALVPLLLISRSYDDSRRSFWKMAGWAVLTFGLWNIACAWWVWIAAPIGTIASTIAQILLFGGIFMIYHYISKRAKPFVAYAILICGWLAAEYLYLTGEISFPWILLGNGFANDTWAIQWYSVTGVFGGSLWILITNLLVFKFITTRNKKWIAGAGSLIAAPIIVSLIMFWTYRQPQGADVVVTVAQPNIDSYVEKFEIPQSKQDSIMLTLAAESPENVDIIAFPETAVDDWIWEEDPLISASVRRFRDFVREERPDAQILLGATTRRMYPDQRHASITARHRNGVWYDVYNTALVVDTTDNVGIFHKKKLVIGAEKMPYMNVLKLLDGLIVDLGGTTGQLGTDDIMKVFVHRRPDGTAIPFSAPICYESVYGEHFANFTARGAQLMFIITNDGWWGDTPGYRNHFSFARLRAIETRRYIARSANTGISGFITPRGDVMQTLGWDKRGTLTDTVKLNSATTFYARHGDYLARISSYVFLFGLIYYVVFCILRSKRNKN